MFRPPALLAAGLALAAAYEQRNITTTPGFRLLPGVASVPAPVVVAPDQDFRGVDGSWNTFSLVVGNPAVNVRVQVSTASQQIWAINRQACIGNITDSKTGQVTQVNVFDSNCESSRGFLYNQTASRTWTQKGFFQLWLEKNLGLDGNGLYGFDAVTIGQKGEQGPSVLNTTVGTLITPNFWIGHLGLHPKPTNFSAFEDPVPSFMTDLFEQRNIPSLSFGYTTGSQYRGPTVLGSLVLGGSDASRYIPNDLTFSFSPDNERDLVVGLVGITANTTSKRNVNLLSRNDVTMFIDSTVAEIWLPVDVCKAFEDAFGLKYDNKTNLYLVDDTLHQSLSAMNPSVTFTLGQKYSTTLTINITLPYAAFDLQASAPYRGLSQSSRYFPIRRGNDSTQWIFGRTFLQEAYLRVDWERQNFSVSAVDWNYGKSSNIIPIVSPKYGNLVDPGSVKSGVHLSTGAIAGIAVGAGFVLASIVIGIGWYFWRRRHNRKLAAIKAKYEADAKAAAAAKKMKGAVKADQVPASPGADPEEGTNVFPKAELHGDSVAPHEIGSPVKEKDPMVISEADNTQTEIFEMPGDIPERQEAGGRQLTEKESMVVRERRYNGVDPNSPDSSPTVQDPPRRLAPLSPDEVALINGRSPTNNVSPITPRTPMDGAHIESGDTFFQLPPYRAREERREGPSDTLFSPISPLEGSSDASRRRFSYES